ncbi:MAG: response regulator transcription factor [Erysipelotrichaceae bacterium]|jgi:two-component system response regulator CssR|nr:response regulator transcription factor [Erysipelotrichaceae bacterium]MBQ1300268.1 response regulator transcription factor [Erysipelotrichaceae bacterium]MBQ1304073.1 response regulator transcription factor [Erysipelotrichaceae bacterium]MBQ1314661.1 response regulator transcription factor [Erysipelotrichaceae bacterium]MBQ1757239.1 response regulator transcription factor [Erysipelotrichaceae bacterium]
MKKVIAIVDDEKDLNELMKSYLEKEGYEVRSYYTYEDAEAHIYDDDVHLWMLDIMLDEKSGFDLFELIKNQGREIPVVFISARDKEFDRIIGLEKGSDDYITKPFNMKEVVLRVNNIIRRSYRDDLQLEVDGYLIDEKQRKVSSPNLANDIDLTTKEFELLILFVHNKGTAFSREDILNKIWGTDYFGSDRVVDDTLRRLRKKMPDLNIHTLYGFGYRLD